MLVALVLSILILRKTPEKTPENLLLGTSKNSLLMLNQRDFADSEEVKPKHTLLYGKALLTVANGGAKRAIRYKSCRKAEPLFGNKIAIQLGIGIFRGALYIRQPPRLFLKAFLTTKYVPDFRCDQKSLRLATKTDSKQFPGALKKREY